MKILRLLIVLVLVASGACVYVAERGVYQRTDSITGSNKVTRIDIPSVGP